MIEIDLAEDEEPLDVVVLDEGIVWRDIDIPESYPNLIEFWMQNGVN